MEILNMYTELQEVERRMKTSCSQILLLNSKLEDLKKRYKKAVSQNKRSFRCVLRTKIVTLEGMINMYYEYTLKKQNQAKELRQKLFGEETEYLLLDGDESGDEIVL